MTDMINKAVPTASADEKYIFISYAHRDSDAVLPILNTLTEKGYRIWYDDGIAPGSEWPEYIAEHLLRSHVVLAFISKNYIASNNCKREMTYALSREIPFIGIIMEQTNMSAGLEMQLSVQQCIMKHLMTEENFYRKLEGTEVVRECLAAPLADLPVSAPDKSMGKSMDEPADKPMDKPTYKPTDRSTDKPADKPTDEPVDKPADEPVDKQPAQSDKTTDKPTDRPTDESTDKPTEKQPAQSDKPTDKPTDKPAGQKKKKKRVVGIVIAAVSAAILLPVLILLVTSLVRSLASVTICGNKYGRNATSVYVYETQVTARDVNNLSKLRSLRSVSFSDCTFTDGDLNTLSNFADVYNIKLQSCTGISDYSFLSQAEAPYNVCITDTDSFRDLSLIHTDKLEELDITNTAVTDLSPLGSAAKLTRLTAAGIPADSADAVLSLEKLKYLDLSDTNITEFGRVCASLYLEELCLRNLEVSDLSAFDDITVLKRADLSGCPITEAECITKSLGTLTSLNLSGTSVSEELLCSVSDAPALEWLNISNRHTGYVSAGILRQPSLKGLYAADCDLIDTLDLTGMSGLTAVDISGSLIEDLVFDPSVTGNRIIDLRDVPLEKLSGLQLGSGDFLLIDDFELAETSVFPESAGAEKVSLVMNYDPDMLDWTPGFTVRCICLVDVPTDKRVAMEAHLKELQIYNYCFLNPEEVSEMILLHGYDIFHWIN